MPIYITASLNMHPEKYNFRGKTIGTHETGQMSRDKNVEAKKVAT